MKNKIIFTLLLMFVWGSKTMAQPTSPSEYTDGLTHFISWISDIDEILSDISDRQRLKRINRQLAFVKSDIDNIATGKTYLAWEIAQLSNASPERELNELKPLVDEIVSDIKTLLDRLEEIKKDVSATDQTTVGQIMQTIRVGFEVRKLHYLKDVRDFLYGKDIALTQIKEEAEAAKKIAEKASEKIDEAKLKIQQKLQ